MLHYEKFLLDSFPNVFKKHCAEIEASVPSPVDKVMKKAVNYLESQCNGKYGFFGEAHTNGDMSQSNSVFMIPTSFDSALLLPYIMNEGVDPFIVQNIVSVLQRSRRSSGFWNYFFDPDHRSFSFIPDDVDDTGVPAVALYYTGNLTLSQCRVLGRKIIKHRLVEPTTGAITTWIPDNQRTIIMDRYQEVPKLCAGCLTNFLWFMAIIGMDTEPEIIPSIDYVGGFVDELIGYKGNDKVELPGMCYYTNKYIMYFFIARFIQKSEYAERKFGKRFVDLVFDEFKLIVDKPKAEALDMACTILSIWHLDLHNVEDCKWGYDEKQVEEIRKGIKRLCERLVSLQHSDGCFRAWVVYRWNKIGHWGGTKSITTGLVLAALGIAKREIYGKGDGFGGHVLKNGGIRGYSSDGQSSIDEITSKDSQSR